MTTTEKETMLRVTWIDSKGTRLSEVTNYSKLVDTLAMIEAEGGELVAVSRLGHLPIKWSGIK